MYKSLFLLAFVFAHCIALCQKIDNVNCKQWDQNNPLHWKDYTITHKKKILKTGFLAEGVTSYQYDFIPEDWNTHACINIVTLFLKRESWVVDTLDPSLLEHERIHFDIGELYARKLRKELLVLYEEGNRSHKVYKMTIDSLFKAGGEYQELYDLETFYGQSQSQQHLWNDTVAQALKQLEDFSFEKMLLRCEAHSR